MYGLEFFVVVFSKVINILCPQFLSIKVIEIFFFPLFLASVFIPQVKTHYLIIAKFFDFTAVLSG